MEFLNTSTPFAQDGKTFNEAQLPWKSYAASATVEYIKIKWEYIQVINGCFKFTFFLVKATLKFKTNLQPNDSVVPTLQLQPRTLTR